MLKAQVLDISQVWVLSQEMGSTGATYVVQPFQAWLLRGTAWLITNGAEYTGGQSKIHNCLPQSKAVGISTMMHENMVRLDISGVKKELSYASVYTAVIFSYQEDFGDRPV